MKKRIDRLNSTAVIRAMYSNDISFIKDLEDNHSINLQDRDGRTALSHAISTGSHEILNWLLSRGADVNLEDKQGWTPLHYAVQHHDLQVVKSLIEAGADINAKDQYGNSVLWRATFAYENNGDIILFLLHSKANPDLKNGSGISAMELAETISNYDVLKYFKN